jgi:hypothetical protein
MTKVIVKSKKPEVVKILLNGAIENEVKLVAIGITKTKKNLKEFEDKYGMSSEEFYLQFKKGKMGDNSDYLRWAGEYETLERLESNEKELKGVKIC